MTSPRKLWSYWMHNGKGERMTVWQVIGVHEGVSQRELMPRTLENDVTIKLLFTSCEPRSGTMKAGQTRLYDSYTMKESDLWEPILKNDIPILLLRQLDD